MDHESPLPTMQKQEQPPSVFPGPTRCSTCGKQSRPRYISHSRNGRPHLGKESEIFKRLQTLGFRILKDILFSARAQLSCTHMGEMGSCLSLGPIFESVKIRDGGQKNLGGSVCWGHNNTPARGNASLVALLNI